MLSLMFTACESENVIINSVPVYYGSMYFVNESGQTIILPSSDNYTQIPFMNLGTMYGVGLIDDRLVIHHTGNYIIDWTISFSDGSNDVFGIGVGLNGVRQQPCYAHMSTTTVGRIDSSAGACILSLSQGDNLTLVIADEAGTVHNPVVFMANIAVQRVG